MWGKVGFRLWGGGGEGEEQKAMLGNLVRSSAYHGTTRKEGNPNVLQVPSLWCSRIGFTAPPHSLPVGVEFVGGLSFIPGSDWVSFAA